MAKRRLAHAHWALVFVDVNRATRQRWESGEFSSVGHAEAIRRLRDIVGVPIHDDFVRALHKIVDKRNNLQHHGLTESPDLVKAMTVPVLGYVLDFIESQLLPAEQAHRREVQACLERIRPALAKIELLVKSKVDELAADVQDLDPVSCPSCNHHLYVPSEGRCRLCGEVDLSSLARHQFLRQEGEVAMYEQMKMPGGLPVGNCPECGSMDAVIGAERGLRCFQCDEYQEGAYERCVSCDNEYRGSVDDDMEVCPDCWEYRMSRD